MKVIENYNKNAFTEYINLVRMINLTKQDIINLREREYYINNKHLFKRCKNCKQIKHKDLFYKNPLKKQGVFDECKECIKEKTRQKRLNAKNVKP